ncbi:MAG: transglycosylase SLT domain-containing protein [Pseudomonadota bacterium]
MGMLRKTKWLWLPVLAMLVSASVTSKLIASNTSLTSQTGQWQMHQILSAAAYESCCSYPLPDNTTPAVLLLPSEKPDAAPVAETEIWVRMRAGFDFPAVDPDTVRSHIDKYIKHPHLFEQLLQRGEPYLFHILNRIEQGGMPAELALLPVIESAFDPLATSPADAAGIWQFMPKTAAYVGLNQDWWYDGRRDVIASTEAALDYLGRLHKRFDGDWFLALAAYNAGGARVQRAIRHNRDAGKPVDFWHLALPAETRSYVPKLIALRAIIENPHDYNISLPSLADTRYFSTVDIQGALEFKVAARLSGIPLHELQRLNPGYGLSITPPGRTHTLLVPRSAAHVFRSRIAQLPQDQRIQSIRHRIRLGDNLSTIAQQYRTTVSDLRKANRLEGSKIIAGDLLIIPVTEREDSIAASTRTTLM